MIDFDKYRTVSMQEILKTGGGALGGVTVRDYFAAKAMQALISSDRYGGIIGCNSYEHHRAVDSYRMADAMMKERNKNVQQSAPTPTVEEAFNLGRGV